MRALGRSDEAEDCFREAAEGHPGGAYEGLDLADHLMYEGERGEARDVLSGLVDSNPDFRTRIGIRLVFLGFADQARRLLEGVLESDPDDVSARLYLARVLRDREEHDRLDELLAPLAGRLSQDPEASFDPEDALHHAYVMALSGRTDSCRAVRERGLQALETPAPGDLYEWACVSALNGDRDAALSLLERAVSLGYRDRDWMRADPDLAVLSDDPRFRSIVAPGSKTGRLSESSAP